jgi:tetratricopeptide (TPR) repeat protein
LLQEAVAASRRVHGTDHPQTLTLQENLGLLLRQMGRLLEAEALYRETLDFRRRRLGPAHPDTLRLKFNLGALLKADRRAAEAEPLFREVLQQYRTLYGPHHAHTQLLLRELLALLVEAQRHAEAEPLAREHLETARQTLPPAQWIGPLAQFSGTLLTLGKAEEAEPLLRECLSLCRQHLPSDHPQTPFMASLLGECLTVRRQFPEAETLLKESYPLLQASQVPALQKRLALERFVRLYDAWGKKDQSAHWRQQAENK